MNDISPSQVIGKIALQALKPTFAFKVTLILMILKSILIFIGFIMILLMVSSDDGFSLNPDLDLTQTELSEEVLKWQEDVEYFAIEYGIEEWVTVLLAIMQVESGGRLPDLMQSSESAGLPVNSLQYEASIEQGVIHLARIINRAKELGIEGDKLGIVQSYNFGTAYIEFLASREEIHDLDISANYSRMVVARSLGNLTGERIEYNHPIAIAHGRPYRYLNGGNFHYAFIVMQYSNSNIDLIDGVALPLESPFRVTCDFYCYENHGGIDLSREYGASVKSVLDGTVIRVVNHFESNDGWFGHPGGYGNFIMIEHEGGIVTVYAHLMQTVLVQVGQHVRAGQNIAFQGNSGSSTGTHLHFEWREDSVRINPELRITLR